MGLQAQEGPLFKCRRLASRNSTDASFPLVPAPPSCLGNRVSRRRGRISENLARAVNSRAAAAAVGGASRGSAARGAVRA